MNAPPARSARFALRDATAEAHQAVEAGFSRLNLRKAEDYRTFLSCRAAALPGLAISIDACTKRFRLKSPGDAASSLAWAEEIAPARINNIIRNRVRTEVVILLDLIKLTIRGLTQLEPD